MSAELALHSMGRLKTELQNLAHRAPKIGEAISQSRAALRPARDATALAKADLAFAVGNSRLRPKAIVAE